MRTQCYNQRSINISTSQIGPRIPPDDQNHPKGPIGPSQTPREHIHCFWCLPVRAQGAPGASRGPQGPRGPPRDAQGDPVDLQ